MTRAAGCVVLALLVAVGECAAQAPGAQAPGTAPALPPPSVAVPAPASPAAAPAGRGRFVVLNFDNADVETVVHAASEIAGFNYVLAPEVRGKVTVQTAGRIPQEDVLGVLLAVLEVHGFTAIRSGNLYKIVRAEGARERAVPTIVGRTPDPARTGDEVITQIVRVRYASAADLGTLLRALVSARGGVVAHRDTNVLMLTDTASNVRRLLEIVALVDVEVALDEVQIIPIRHADAADLATVLNQLIGTGRLRRGATGPTAPVAVPAPTPGRPGTPTAAAGDVGAERAPLIIGDRRSNSLIVHARPHELETVKRLVGQLDVDVYAGRRVFVHYAENAKAKELASTLNQIYGGRDTTTTTTTGTATTGTSRGPGQAAPPPPPLAAGGAQGDAGLVEGQVRFIPDETTNAVIVTTYPRLWGEIEATIKQLDRMPRQVLIETFIAEVTLTDNFNLGIDWAIKSGSLRLFQQSLNPSAPTIPGVPAQLPTPPTSALTLPGAGLTAVVWQAGDFLAIINALAAENRLNVLSSPHVLTSENKKAVINVSDSIPIVTSQQVPLGGTTTTDQTTAVVGTQTVEYRDAGVILTVTPRIGERGTVALDIKQEVNDIGNQEPPTNSRRIIKREAETSVVLQNNQTLVLGGLIQERHATENRGIPFLKDIPLIGYLFGSRGRQVVKTELLIVITPRVIGTPLDAARVTDQKKRATTEMEDATRRWAPAPPPTSPGAPPGPPPAPPPPGRPAP